MRRPIRESASGTLIIDANAELTSAGTPEFFKPVAWRSPKVVNALRRGQSQMRFASSRQRQLILEAERERRAELKANSETVRR